ncbi:hypothetical protein JCM11251_004086 [Rhodosporidiobolus azoricus]
MLPFGQRTVFHLTSSTPPCITYEQGISPRHTLNVHDVDGEGKDWTVQGSVAKVSIYNSRNLVLRLPGRIVTSTVEIFNCDHLTVIIGSPPSPSATDETSPLGVLQLDPTINDVTIQYASPSYVGSVVVAPDLSTSRTTHPTFGFSSLSLQLGYAEPFLLFDAEGNLRDPSSPGTALSPAEPPSDLSRQLVLKLKGQRWTLEGLARGEKDYPQLS